MPIALTFFIYFGFTIKAVDNMYDNHEKEHLGAMIAFGWLCVRIIKTAKLHMSYLFDSSYIRSYKGMLDRVILSGIKLKL